MYLLLIISLFSTGDCSGVALNLNRSARAYAMGGSFVAVVDDIAGYYYNPATLGSIRGHSASFSYFPIAIDIMDNSLLLAYTTDKFVGSFNISYLGYGEFLGLDEHARNEYTFEGNDLIVGLGGAFALKGNLYLGSSISYFREKLEEFTASSYLLDIGLHNVSSSFSWGVSLKNLGLGLKFIDSTYALPYTLSLGAGKVIGKNVYLTGGIDVPADNVPVLKSGIEYSINDMLFLRTGLRSDKSGVFSKLLYGIGLNFKGFELDFASSQYQDIGLTYVVSLSYK